MLAPTLSHWKLISAHSMLNVCVQPGLKSEVIYLDDTRLDTLASLLLHLENRYSWTQTAENTERILAWLPVCDKQTLKGDQVHLDT